MGIKGIISGVAEDKIFVLRYYYPEENIGGRLFNIGFVQRQVINIYDSVSYLYRIVG
jgi:hypothetical protein